jgi:AcrR family transcriptional regulator
MTDTRRRGAALEDALLEAAWAELVDRGYAGLTMESVAKRAGTSRPVLARRWETPSDLAIAALRRYHKNNPIEAPDLGEIRAELIVLLQRFSDRGARIMTTVMLNMSEYFIETGSSIADIRDRIIGDSKLKDVLERAVARGELDPRKLTARISTLPVDLVRHEVIMTRKPVSTETIEEILDTIFLPLAATASRR